MGKGTIGVIKDLLDKYKQINKNAETIYVSQVVQDLYNLLNEVKILRLPPDER